MADHDDDLDLADLTIQDPATDNEDLQDASNTDDSQAVSRSKTPRLAGSSAVDQDAREEVLRAELAGVRQINTAIEGVISSLEKAKDNMQTVSSTVDSANRLMNLWIRILSQQEHTQRLLLSGRWEGASRDLDDIEAEAAAKVHEAERRQEEARERAAAREREAAAAEARRLAAEAKKPARGGVRRGVSRGKPPTAAAGTSVSRAGSVSSSSTPSSLGRAGASSRTTRASAVGRYGRVRGRGRGATGD